MALTPLKEFNLRWSQFKNPPVTEPPTPSFTDAQIRWALEKAEKFLCPNQWGTNFREACLLFAAIALSEVIAAQTGLAGAPGSGVMGPVASASVGGESVSYGSRGRTAVRFSEEWYLSYPPFGAEFLALRDSSILGAAATRTGFRGDWHGSPC